ncbi:MAG: AAA family ATPase [Elusimicrobia bacterium]|nr:AAA family ATPase [Elusimicrobiota bacterium]
MNKWLSKLEKLDGAVNLDKDPFSDCIKMPTPSLSYIFGKSRGLPKGFSATFFGPPGGGKTLLTYAIIGQLHRDDPEAIVVKFNTELREHVQLPKEQYSIWGIDPERYIAYNVNTPDGIFDKIEKEINSMCADGAPIKLISIDSLNNIQGRRFMDADTIMTQQRGDEAATLQEGFKRLLPVIRRYNIGLICTNQVRAEMDPDLIRKGKKVRMAAAFAVQHYVEYWIYVDKNRNKDGKTDAIGNEFIDTERKDLDGKEEKTGFKIKYRMEKSSIGIDGRVGELTFDYKNGIINTHEEIFGLAVNVGVIKRPNNVMYEFDGDSWRGEATMISAIKDSPELYSKLQKAIFELDSR